MTSAQPDGSPRAGLREAHAHIAHHGRAMSMARFEGCADLPAFLDLAARAAAARSGEWTLGIGLRTESWPQRRYPTRAELDAATGDTPFIAWSFDHHALLANSAAMRAAGLREDAPDPEHGRIDRDAHGRPSGVFLERAAKALWEKVPEPSPAQWREHIRAAIAHLHALGFAEVHDLLSQPWLGPILGDLDRAGQLPCRVRLYPLLPDAEVVHAGRERWQSERVALAGAKVFVDGTLNSRTAWMLHPYADPLPGLPRGQAMLTPKDLIAAIGQTRRLGIGLAVHAIGDAAVRAALDAAEQCPDPGQGLPSGPVAGSPGLRIEHAELIDQADIPRFARLGITVSLQPCHLLADVEALRRSLPHRLGRVLPIRELIEAGLTPGDRLWFGSDTPIVRPEPQDSIDAAVFRRRPAMAPAEAIAPEQAIDEATAWRCFQGA
jgi:predicted amidohydrolase YtcJ